MKTRLLHLWDVLSSSYWFVPSIMAAGATLLAFVMLAVDRRLLSGQPDTSWFYSGGVEGARSLLSTVASSTITVTGVVFSITIAALTQASNQFGPRLLRNFMRDAGNQFVLGTFAATFVYCILVLRTVHGQDQTARVPQASVTVAVLLAVASVAVLIYFIHHVSLSLQAPQVVARVAQELSYSIERQFPAGIGTEGNGRQAPQYQPEEAYTVKAAHDGYIQAIDESALLETAVRQDAVVRLHCRPGHYVLSGTPLMDVVPASACDDTVADELRAVFIVGTQRTPEQDVEYAIHQLVEIALRALSPGINDPFTAIACIDRLGSSLMQILRQALPTGVRCDERGRVRVVAPVSTFAGLVDAAFNQIRQAAGDHLAVSLRLLEVIGTILPELREPEHVRPLQEHARMIYEAASAEALQERDRGDLEARYAAVLSSAMDGAGCLQQAGGDAGQKDAALARGC